MVVPEETGHQPVNKNVPKTGNKQEVMIIDELVFFFRTFASPKWGWNLRPGRRRPGKPGGNGPLIIKRLNLLIMMRVNILIMMRVTNEHLDC